MTTVQVERGAALAKAATGIRGFDQITGGGLPRGRPTLICGGPGSGKTMFGMEFLIRGATERGEPGVFVSFEETPLDLAKNVASLGFDVGALIDEKKIAIDHVRVERSEIEAGVPIIWLVDPEALTVTVLAANLAPVTLHPGDTLDGGNVLPELQIVIADIFE